MAAGSSLNAAVVQKSPSEVKIYINPGHGGWNSNCRPMGTVKHGENTTTSTTANDTTNFFESNTNLWKCLALYHKLVDYGVPEYGSNALFDSGNYSKQHLVMSRITNGNSTDRALSSDIAVEVEKYSPDIFISVHSNASPDGTIGANENYPLVIYRGEDYESSTFTDTGYGKNWDYAGTGLNGAGSSYEFGKLVYSHLATIEHEPYTDEWPDQYVSYSGYNPLKTGHNVRGDVNLRDYFDQLNNGTFTYLSNRGSGTTNSYSNNKYYGYYGVMKHGAVGVLSEGYMHTYYPSVNRHMNKDVCAIEGISYAHAIADYFGWEKEKTGYIYGIVRDRNTTFTHTYYIPNQNSDDIYKPLNNCMVKLYKDGVLVDTYVTDDEWNGAFVFYDLEPGDYTLDYECDGYQAASEGLKSTVVTVKANEITYPKAFLNAEGYSMNSGTSLTEQWRQDFGSVGNGFWLQGAATTDANGYETVYTVPAIQALSDLYFIATYYTKGYSLRNGSVCYFSSGSTSSAFPYGSGSYYQYGPGIAADNAGTLWTPSFKGSTALAWAAGIKAVAYYTARPGYQTSGGQDSAGTKSGIDLSSYSIGRSDLISAYGDGINSTGALWFSDVTNNEIVCVKLNKATVSKVIRYSAPVTVVTRSLTVQYSDTEIMYNCGRDDSNAKIYKGIIDESTETVSWTDLGVTTVNNAGTKPAAGATMFRLAGNEYLAYSSSTTQFTIKNITTGETIVTTPGMTSASSYVNHSINAIIKDDNNADIYVYVPGAEGGAIKYTLTVYNNPDDPSENVEAEATEMTNYEQSINVTWEASDTWTVEPTNYLVKYKTSYVNADGETVESDWLTAGMTADATCEYVHENVGWVAVDGQIYPQTYTYKIIPNFNCYDGEESEISSSVTLSFVAPEPVLNDVEISPVYETAGDVNVELSQYDGEFSWYGVDFDSNSQFALAGYKFEIYSSADTSTPVTSLTFYADDAKYFGTIDSTTGEGAVLDANGNAIENLTYSIAADGRYLFTYRMADMDVLDIVDGNPETRWFNAYLSTMFTIENTFVYSTPSITKMGLKSYSPVAPTLSTKVSQFNDYSDVFWVNMNLNKPSFGDADEVPVSYYLLWLDKDKDGTPDEYIKSLYIYDPQGSLGLQVTDEIDDKGYVKIEGVSTMSLSETSGAAVIPGTYDFSQTSGTSTSTVEFIAYSTTDTDGTVTSAKNYLYGATAVYAAGNELITTSANNTVEPTDGGVMTGVVEAISETASMSIYPVPATVQVTVKAGVAIETIGVYSTAGTLVKTLDGNGSIEMTVPVADLEAGVYFLRVNGLNPVKIVKK